MLISKSAKSDWAGSLVTKAKNTLKGVFFCYGALGRKHTICFLNPLRSLILHNFYKLLRPYALQFAIHFCLYWHFKPEKLKNTQCFDKKQQYLINIKHIEL